MQNTHLHRHGDGRNKNPARLLQRQSGDLPTGWARYGCRWGGPRDLRRIAGAGDVAGREDYALMPVDRRASRTRQTDIVAALSVSA